MTSIMEYDFTNGGYEGSYKGFTICAKYNGTTENPWVMWDNNTPMIYVSGRQNTISEHAEGDQIQNPLSYYTEGQLSRHWKAICKVLDLKVEDVVREVRENVEEQNADHYNDERRCIFDDTLQSLSPSYYKSPSDYLTAIAAMFNLIGIHATATSVIGYSQGDYADLLFVLTPEHRKRCGYSKRNEKKFFQEWFETDANLWKSWAYGDVYYCEISLSGEVLHSEGEFFGTDHEKSYLEETGKDTVDYIIKSYRAEKSNRLKQLIKNKVSILRRPKILNKISYSY